MIRTPKNKDAAVATVALVTGLVLVIIMMMETL